MRMTPAANGSFTATFDRVTTSFPSATIADHSSDEFAIEVIRPARVTRIDVRYTYPRGLGLKPRVKEDRGDIYGPAGTTVDLTVTTDKPVARGAITMTNSSTLALGAGAQVLTASMPIRADGSYRVALTDVDGFENPGETEYFIRVHGRSSARRADPAPAATGRSRRSKRSRSRPAPTTTTASRPSTSSMPLHGGKETVVPFRPGAPGRGERHAAAAAEDLGVEGRATSSPTTRAPAMSPAASGRTETRSDIFFLEVKPFNEEFVAAQSQALGAASGGRQLEDSRSAQKEIISATWKLDRRTGAAADRSADDIIESPTRRPNCAQGQRGSG